MYKQTAFQDGDSQVSKTVDNGQRLGCLHRSDRCISSCSHTYDIRKYLRFVHEHKVFQFTALPFKMSLSMDFHKINGSNSSALTTSCHVFLPIPRRLANKRSNSQSTNLSHKILPSNGTESRLHTKSKEIRLDTSTEIYLYRYGISDLTEHRVLADRVESYSDYHNNSFSNFGTNFPFSFGQTQCSSGLNFTRQTAFTTSADVPIIGLKTSCSFL